MAWYTPYNNTVRTTNQKTSDSYLAEQAFCQKVDRILAGNHKIVVERAKHLPAPAAANDWKILIDFDQIMTGAGGKYDEFFTRMKALNYHELCHILFTNINYNKHLLMNQLNLPRLKTMTVTIDQVKDTLNLLEDARIENFFVATYPNAGKYFKYIVYKLIINNPRPEAQMKVLDDFLLTYGRKYLPRDQLKKFELAATKSKLMTTKDIQTVKAIIDEYITVHDRARLINLGIDMAEIVFAKIPDLPDGNDSPCSTPNREEKNGKMTKQAMEKVKQAVEHNQKKDEEESKAEADANTGDGDGDQGQAGKGKKKQNKKAGSGSKPSESDELTDTHDDIESALDELKEAINDEITDEIQDVKGNDDIDDSDNFPDYEPGYGERVMSGKVTNLLKKLRNGLGSYYINNQKSGHINIRTVIQKKHTQDQKVFKKYHPSRLDKSKMAVALLIDASGSMGSENYRTVLQTAWSMNDSFTKLGDKTMVIEYSDEAVVLKKFRHKQGIWKRHQHGGTTAGPALKIASKELEKQMSTNNIKSTVMIILTDGGLGDTENAKKEIKMMNKKGVKTIFITAGYGTPDPNSFGATKGYHINKFDELEGVIRKVVSQVQWEVAR